MGSKSLWCIDTNVLASWILVDGGLLDYFLKSARVPENYVELYRKKYAGDISFINKIIKSKNEDSLSEQEFYIPFLATNEVFSALKDEILCLRLFEKGEPVSTWPRNKAFLSLNEGEDRVIFEIVMRKLDELLESGVSIIDDCGNLQHNVFWDVFASLLLQSKNTRTQDVMLLTTSVVNSVDYFVTRDERLIQAIHKQMMEAYDLELLNPSSAYLKLKRLDGNSFI